MFSIGNWPGHDFHLYIFFNLVSASMLYYSRDTSSLELTFLTTKKVILRDTTQILMETVTKSNRLVKNLRTFGGGCFHLRSQTF